MKTDLNSTVRGFTLVEVMIVVVIVAMLAMMAMPSFLRALENSRNARYAHDVRVAASSFETYALEHGSYPPDRNPGQMPDGMADYLAKVRWTDLNSLGGQWDWDQGVFSVMAGVSVYQPKASLEQMQKLDAMIDDGNLGKGIFRSRSQGYLYVIEE